MARIVLQRTLMKNLLLALVIGAGASLTAGSAWAVDLSIGVVIGAPPAPRVVAVVPSAPGPDWVWVTGYWFPTEGRYRWHDGYWTRPPYVGAVWIGPHYEGGRYFAGFWNGDHGRFEHDHHWDRGHERDYGHFRDRDDHDHDRGKHRGEERGHGHGHDRD